MLGMLCYSKVFEAVLLNRLLSWKSLHILSSYLKVTSVLSRSLWCQRELNKSLITKGFHLTTVATSDLFQVPYFSLSSVVFSFFQVLLSHSQDIIKTIRHTA